MLETIRVAYQDKLRAGQRSFCNVVSYTMTYNLNDPWRQVSR